MHALGIIAAVLAVGGLIQEFLLLVLFKPYRSSSGSTPHVSVLVAMRNERQNAERCLDSIRAQVYDGEFEILVGDDKSDDGTFEFLVSYAQQYPEVRVERIEGQLGESRGKGNVIGHLAKCAKGEVWLIMDADSWASPTWIQTMAENWQNGVGLVNGLTEVDDHALQNLEWLHSQGMLHVMHRWKVLTAVGNNMGVEHGAYWKTGGYEQIPFSLTEDRALAVEIEKHGMRLESRICKGSLVSTKGMHGWKDIVKQRMRWMSGAVRLPWWIVGMLMLQALYYPAIVIYAWHSALGAALIFTAKAIIQIAYIRKISQLGKASVPVWAWIVYEFYAGFMAWFHIILHLLPGKVTWKGRDFTERV